MVTAIVSLESHNLFAVGHILCIGSKRPAPIFFRKEVAQADIASLDLAGQTQISAHAYGFWISSDSESFNRLNEVLNLMKQNTIYLIFKFIGWSAHRYNHTVSSRTIIAGCTLSGRVCDENSQIGKLRIGFKQSSVANNGFFIYRLAKTPFDI